MKKAPTEVVDQKLAAGSNIFIKCGDCLHFAHSAHPAKGSKPCKDLGVVRYANAPVCYTPNVHAMKSLSQDTFSQLAYIVSSFTASDARTMVGLLRQQARLQRAGFSFLEKVYLRVGLNFLGNYFSGYALGVSPTGEVLLVGTNYLARSKSSVVAQVLATSLIREPDFEKIRQELTKLGKLQQPEDRRAKVTVEYEPPTFDTSPETLDALARKVKPLKTKSIKTLEVNLTDL
jgi:hypothetical protein